MPLSSAYLMLLAKNTAFSAVLCGFSDAFCQYAEINWNPSLCGRPEPRAIEEEGGLKRAPFQPLVGGEGMAEDSDSDSDPDVPWRPDRKRRAEYGRMAARVDCNGWALEDRILTSPYDFSRLCRFTLSPGIVCGVDSFLWYYTILPYLIPSSVPHSLMKKILLDVCVFIPWSVAIGMGANALMARPGDWEFCKAKVRNDWAPAVVLAQAIFLPADLIQFTFIPLELSVLYGKTIGVAQRVGTSYFINRPTKVDDATNGPGGEGMDPHLRDLLMGGAKRVSQSVWDTDLNQASCSSGEDTEEVAQPVPNRNRRNFKHKFRRTRPLRVTAALEATGAVGGGSDVGAVSGETHQGL